MLTGVVNLFKTVGFVNYDIKYCSHAEFEINPTHCSVSLKLLTVRNMLCELCVYYIKYYKSMLMLLW